MGLTPIGTIFVLSKLLDIKKIGLNEFLDALSEFVDMASG